jgi:hypothetical protein
VDRFRVALLVLVASILSACAGPPPVITPPPAPTPLPQATRTPRPLSVPDYGVHTFIWGQPATTRRDLQLVTDAGFNWIKSLFPWREIEGAAKGQFTWTEADRVVRASRDAGINVIARLDFEPTWSRKDQAHNGPPDNYQDYWDFVSAFVARYSTGSSIGRVRAVEIWNEPNLDREWGQQPINADSAADYVRLLDGAYQAAHSADPNIIVLSAGLSPTGVTDGHSADDLEFLKWMYSAGLQGKFDVLGAHANAQAPEVRAPLASLKDFPHPSFYFRRIEQLRQVMVEHGDAAKQMWLLEWGWTSDSVHPNYAWFAVSEDKKADNLIGGFNYAREFWTPWLGVMSVWTLADPTWDKTREEYWWAITDPDGSPRTAYTRIRAARESGALR